MKRNFTPILIVVIILLAVTFPFVDPSGKILAIITPYARILGGGLIGLLLLGVVAFVLLSLISGKIQTNAAKKHPNFYEEMQSALRTVLLPLGFEEKEGSDLARYTEYSRDALSVWLTLDVRDSIYYVTASSRSEIVNDEKRPIPDFTTECLDMRKVDEFKSESMAKLNEWLVRQRVR